MRLDTGSVRVSNPRIWEAFGKTVSNSRRCDSHVRQKKVSHFLAFFYLYIFEIIFSKMSSSSDFGLEVLLFTANVARAKEQRGGNIPFGVAGMGRVK
jgi:hypothetical protein